MCVALGALTAHSYHTLWCAAQRQRCACNHVRRHLLVHDQCMIAEGSQAIMQAGNPWASLHLQFRQMQVVHMQSPSRHKQGTRPDGLPSRAGQGLLQREVDGEPGEHVRRVAGRVRAQAHIAIPAPHNMRVRIHRMPHSPPFLLDQPSTTPSFRHAGFAGDGSNTSTMARHAEQWLEAGCFPGGCEDCQEERRTGRRQSSRRSRGTARMGRRPARRSGRCCGCCRWAAAPDWGVQT